MAMEPIAPRIVKAQVNGTVTQTHAIAERHEETKMDLGERIARNPISMTCAGRPNNEATPAQGTRYANSMNLPPYNSWNSGFAARLTRMLYTRAPKT